MILKDSGIFSPKIDSSQNLVFTIKVARTEYTEAMQQFIFDSYNQWKQLDLEVVGLQDKNDEILRLRQRLALVMSEYALKVFTSWESLKNSLYTRYNVTSRTELTREQLEEAIRFYSDWLRYD